MSESDIYWRLILKIESNFMIGVIIAKPTLLCNADCSYCSSPPDGSTSWSDKELRKIFTALKGNLEPNATFIWHGGEPLLMGPDFYRRAYAISQELTPEIKFSVQSNLLLYKSSRWKSVFEDIFMSSCSTSYEPDEKQRTIKGDPVRYSRTFFKKIDEVMNDGFRPLVIGTFTEETAPLMHLMYEKSLSRGDLAYDIRLNYCSPVGRGAGSGLLIEPETYGATLIELYDRWIKDAPAISITPLNQMMGMVLGLDGDRCPWTRKCGGSFLGILPNGDTYNCGEFSDISDDWKYGNILDGTYSARSGQSNIVNFYRKSDQENLLKNMLASGPAVEIKRRSFLQPDDCKSCRHFAECQGGCARDAVLYERGIGGKFMYCRSWKMVFDRIKQSILNGEADNLMLSRGVEPADARMRVINNHENIDLARWDEQYAKYLP